MFAIALTLVVLSSGWSLTRSLRRRQLSIDVIALIAMVGALALDEYLAAAVIAVMLAGGNALEAAATGRAKRELTALLERARRGLPTAAAATGSRRSPVDALGVGDIVLVRSGEVVPVDGVVVAGEALVDEASLTGEALPVVVRARRARAQRRVPTPGPPSSSRPSPRRADSAYAALVRLVERAQGERAPFVRLADRYATIFLPVTLLVAGIAWLLSGDPVRALAVVVVATPCPLILAAPIALISGISRAARRGILVKGGGAIEQLGAARTVLLDKTGTVTHRRARESSAWSPSTGSRTTRSCGLAASLDQLSAHVMAEALVGDAVAHGLELSTPSGVVEDPGSGIEGRVDGRVVTVGSARWLREPRVFRRQGLPLRLTPALAPVLVGVDGTLAGALVMADRVRPDAAAAVDRLRRRGVDHVAMVSGDRAGVVRRVGREIGVDQVYAERSPEGKLDIVARHARGRARGGRW